MLTRKRCVVIQPTLTTYSIEKSFSTAVSSESHPKGVVHKERHMVVCDFTAHIPRVKKCLKFSPHIRTWKLRDLATASQLQSALKLKVTTAMAAAATAAGVTADTANRVEKLWSVLKDPLVTEVCGLSKNLQWRLETWWWN